MGHARAILALATAQEQSEMANRTAAMGLSVRQVERNVNAKLQPPPETARRSPAPTAQDPNVRAAARELEDHLGTKVRIVERNEMRGTIEIDYYSPEDL